jgi:hypothetical protein
VFSLVTDPTAGAARALQTVAWGLAGSAGRAELRVAGRPVVPSRTAHGAFLVLAAGDVQAGEIGGEVGYGGGAPVRLRLGSFQGRAAIEFRSPDPNGGLPFGISATRRADGRWCTSGWGRIVGDRVGGIDYDLGTFTDQGPTRTAPARTTGRSGSRRRRPGPPSPVNVRCRSATPSAVATGRSSAATRSPGAPPAGPCAA